MTLSTDDWRVSDWDYGLVVTGKLNDPVCQCVVGDDAALIVRAVNAHAALVSALEAMCEEQRHPSPAYEAAQKLLASLD